MLIEADRRRVPRLTPGDRRRFLKTRIIAIEGERDRLEARLEALRWDLYKINRGKSWSDPEVLALVEEIGPTNSRRCRVECRA